VTARGGGGENGDVVLLEPAPPIATLRLNRPEKLNAISAQVIGALDAHLRALAADDAIAAVVLAGGERAFAAGADVDDLPEPAAAPAFIATWRCVLDFPKPIVAAVAGHCLGGGFELVLMCDIVVAAGTARFGLPETGLGLLPGAGGTQLLPRTVGRSMAAEVVLAGRVLSADEALAQGIASRVVPAGELEETARSVATSIAAKGPLATRHAKAALQAARALPLADGLARECESFAALLGSEDWVEGRSALAERRRPSFTGR
jgi:enoyl-CoA hydratase/carnithine racemase